jgi:hypothetical protein
MLVHKLKLIVQPNRLTMKYKLCFLAIVAFISTVSMGQEFKMGVKAGADINKLSGVSFSEKFTYGYHAGVFTEIPLGDKWALQPELLFSQTSTDTTSKFRELYQLSASKLSNIKLNYLSVPLLLSYRPSKIVSISAGPQFGVLMDQQKNILENGRAAFKNGNLSLLAGLQLNLGSMRVYGRYAVGLNNINDIDNQDKWRGQSIQLGVGFSIL